MEFSVTREGTALVTLHEGTDTTAIEAAREELREALSRAADGTVSSWAVGEGTVHEHPVAPFDPYTVSVAFSITVAVEAGSAEEASSRGEGVIEGIVATAGLDGVSFPDPPTASAC